MANDSLTQAIEEWDRTLELLSSHFSISHERKITTKDIFDAISLLVSDERSIEW